MFRVGGSLLVEGLLLTTTVRLSVGRLSYCLSSFIGTSSSLLNDL